MESPGKKAQPHREKRHAALRKSPYARQEGTSRSDTKTPSDRDDETPSLALRITRFINPWHKEKQDSLSVPPKLDTEETIVVEEIEEIDADEVPGEETSENVVSKVETSETLVSKVETHDVVEYLDEDVSSNFFSQTTMVVSSQEVVSTPEGSVADVGEELQDIKHRLEWEGSTISGQDSDSTPDRKESKRSKRKPQSRSPAPTRPTRRTTRSLAAKVEDDANREESATPDPELISNEPIESTEAQTQEEQPETSKTRSQKKKKKGKSSKRGATEEIEEVGKETAEQSERIAEQIRKSEEVIKESESLGKELETLDKSTKEVLDHVKGPFLPAGEELMSEAGVEDDDQTFHSTMQFEAMDTAEEDVMYYEPEDNDGEGESADTVKYYPPESPVAEGTQDIEVAMEPKLKEKTEEMAEQAEMLDAPYDSESMGEKSRSPSPPAAASIPECLLLDSEDFEFSPMQSRSPSPRPKESTPPQSESFVDCPPIVTPRAEKTSIEHEHWNEFDMHPVHNIDILEAFFKRQKGHLLTPMQADYCCQLIMDSVIPSSDTKWVSGEDGVSFRNPLAAQAIESPIKDSASNNLARPVSTTQDRPLATTVAPVSDISALRPVPFAVIRQPAGTEDVAPKLPPLPPLDEYLEIEKYKGVEWDDLPSHVRVKRYLEWKSTESPEVTKKRRMEERERTRKENAEFWARREKAEAEALASVAAGVPSKRKASVSESLSDVENETFGRKRITEMVTDTMVSPVASAPISPVTKAKVIEGTAETAQSAPRAQTAAEIILAIVRNDSKLEEEKKAEPNSTLSSAPPVEPLKPASSQLMPTAPTFSFGTAAKTSTETSSKSMFGNSTTSNSDNSPKPLFGATPVTTASNSTSSTTTSSFSFATPKSDTPSKADMPAPVKPTFNFGIPASVSFVPTTTSPTLPSTNAISFSAPKDASKSTHSAWGAPPSFGADGFKTSSPSFGAPTNANKDEPKGSSPWGISSGFGKDASKTTSLTWGGSPSSDKGVAKTGTSPWGTPAGSNFAFAAPAQPTSPTTNRIPSFTDVKPSSFGPFSGSPSSGFSFGVAAAASGFGSNKSPVSFGMSSNQSTSANPFAAFSAKPSISESSKHGKDNAGEQKEQGKQEKMVILSDDDEEERNSYNDENEDGWSGTDDNAFYGDSGQEDTLQSGDDIEGEGEGADEDDNEDDDEDDDDEGSGRSQDNTSIFGKPGGQFSFGQSTTTATARRPSGTDLFERRESSSSFGQQAPRTPEFTFEFGPPKISTIARPGSPSPGSKGASLFGNSQFGQAASTTTPASTSSPFGSFGASTWGGSNISAPVFSFNTRSNSRGSGFDTDDYEEDEPHFDKYEEDEDGSVSPFSSPILSPRQSPL
ncbi:hypothetical protein BGX27_006803 [Mortierella sp. AM989]|nr:hypothetical protein BGX27_006803 [Mortierella sp. AM989]